MRRGPWQRTSGEIDRSTKMDFDVLIPARYSASRLPGKPLLDIRGKPLIQWVYECATASAAKHVIVATDDERVKQVVEGFGGEVFMTRSDHRSGSDRVAEVVTQLDLPKQRVVVNVQGDEPRIPGSLIDQVAALVCSDEALRVGTASHGITERDELDDPNVVKVVTDYAGYALYFSRAPVPWPREAPEQGAIGQRHIGIYGYRAGFLREFTRWPATRLEKIERLEQLRILENGVPIAVCEADDPPGPGIDTPQDLEQFRAAMGYYG